MPDATKPSSVAVIIPAKDEADRIRETVTAARRITGVDLVVVVDDGSTDRTAVIAEAAGAQVVRHDRNEGKGTAMESGAGKVATLEALDRMHAPQQAKPPRALLFLDADLQDTALNTQPLVTPILAGDADMTIARLPAQNGAAGGRGRVVRTARAGIEAATGWSPTQPLSGMRCLSREAFDAVQPLAAGWGVETGLTIDALRRGLRVAEVDCDLQHRVSGKSFTASMHRAAQLRDVVAALSERGLLKDVANAELAHRKGKLKRLRA